MRASGAASVSPAAAAASSTTSEAGSSTANIISRALTPNSLWPDKEELLDVIYWVRQLIGIIVGLVWGYLGVTGAKGLVSFAALNAGTVLVYLSGFQQVDDEEFGGKWELTKEGFMTSFAGFLATWIIVYTGLYMEDSM